MVNLQHVVAELKNIREQAINDDEIGKESILEAITDLIHDASGDGGEWMFEDEDHYDTFESEPDYTQLEIID
tara:strand:+ start:179 stop:394 length:216 start_codon:yes stop_codon:yes gene_type:complete